MPEPLTVVLIVFLCPAAEPGVTNLGAVGDPGLVERYAAEARWMADVHDPDDVI